MCEIYFQKDTISQIAQLRQLVIYFFLETVILNEKLVTEKRPFSRLFLTRAWSHIYTYSHYDMILKI